MKRKADLSQPLADIYRILYCGSCKSIWQMRGKLKVLKRGLKRSFTCPNCKELCKIDWFKNPSTMAIETRLNHYPQFYNDDLIEYNKALLGVKWDKNGW